MVEGIFSQEEIDFLKEFYVKYGGLYCAEKLNRSVGSVVSKTSKLKTLNLNWIFVTETLERQRVGSDDFLKVAAILLTVCRDI